MFLSVQWNVFYFGKFLRRLLNDHCEASWLKQRANLGRRRSFRHCQCVGVRQKAGQRFPRMRWCLYLQPKVPPMQLRRDVIFRDRLWQCEPTKHHSLRCLVYGKLWRRRDAYRMCDGLHADAECQAGRTVEHYSFHSSKPSIFPLIPSFYVFTLFFVP